MIRVRRSNTSHSDIKVDQRRIAKAEKRYMDCIDCHNRPTHAFELPENAVDLRMSRGVISTRTSLHSQESRGIVEGSLILIAKPQKNESTMASLRFLSHQLS